MEYYFNIAGLVVMIAVLPILILSLARNREAQRGSLVFLLLIVIVMTAYEAISIWGVMLGNEMLSTMRALFIMAIAVCFLSISIALYKRK